MPYTKTTWTDEVPASLPVKYKITDDTDGVIANSAKIEIVTSVTAGTALNATNLNKLETGVETAQATAEASVQKSIVTAVGDILYGAAAGVIAALAKPSVTSILKITSAGVLSWEPEAKYLKAIGEIVELDVATNPATLYGYGTWVLFAVGRMTVCIDTSQTEFDTLDKTGGAKTVSLTGANNGPHEHAYSQTLSVTHDDTTSTGTLYNVQASVTANTASSGSGTAHENLPPYTVVYRWKRTA